MALISRKVFSCSGYICCFVQIIFDSRPLGIRTTILGLDSDSRGGFGALSVVSDGAFYQGG